MKVSLTMRHHQKTISMANITLRTPIISRNDIDPKYQTMAQDIVHQLKRKQSVHIPAMNNQCLGQLLYCLKIYRFESQ